MSVRKKRHELAARQSSKLVVLPDLNTPEKQQEIADLAFEFWLARGFRNGSPAEDLFRAEREVKMRSLKPVKRKAPPARKPLPASVAAPPAADPLPALSIPAHRPVGTPPALAPERLDHHSAGAQTCRICDQFLREMCLQAQAWAINARAIGRAAMEKYQHAVENTTFDVVTRDLYITKSRYFELKALHRQHLAMHN